MSVQESKDKVYIYQNDFQNICNEVYKHQNIETGGNLFGLWTTSGSAVIHVVLGPGQGCRRTDVSFHQDLEYMGRVGHFVNKNYMLCHIGEWHSHHKLSLNKPSQGDLDTIRRNFPEGMSKFLVIIANIKDSDTIILSPYFFTHGGTRYEKAERKTLLVNSPFSTDEKILAQIENGAEKIQNGRHEISSTAYRNQESTSLISFQGSKSSSSSRANPRSSDTLVNLTTSRLQNTSNLPVSKPNASLSHINESSTISQVNANTPNSHGNPHGPATGDHVEPMDTNDSDPPPNEGSSNKPVTTSQPSSPVHSPTEREIVVKKIHDQLKYWFGSQPESEFKFQKSKDSPGVVEIVFKHNRKSWMVHFPQDFPKSPAKLFSSLWEPSLRSDECHPNDIIKPLNNEVNILLTIKNKCYSGCKVCKNFTKEKISQSSLTSNSMEKLSISVNSLVSELTETFSDVTALNINQPLDISHAEVAFKHGRYNWIINLPAPFPEIPAKVYYLAYEGSSQKHDALFCGNSSVGQIDLNTSILIIKAILWNCSCRKCLDLRYRSK